MGRFFRRARACGWGLFRVVLLLSVAGLAMSCGRGTFVGRQYDDFTAYYNAFYNANQAFEAGLESVTESGGDIDRGRYIPVFPTPQGGSGESSFEKAIQKSADLLRENPNSKWVDDALLLIGRARYYQQNYVGAAQKFREVVALGAEREGEARFRLAQTLVAADRYTEAAEALRSGLEQGADYGTWTARMRLARGELLVRQENWKEAEQALARGLTDELPDDTGARAAFLLGQVRETLEDFDGARVAYRQVLDYDPTYSLEFAARLGGIEMRGLEGRPEEALERLESLERADNTSEMRGQIARVRAQLFEEQGRPERAKRALTDGLRGAEAPTGTVQGRLHYDLAALYRDTYEDYTRAAAHFDTASTTLSSGGGRDTESDAVRQALPRAPSDAAAQADRFRGLADRSQAVARMDSLLRLGRMPPAEFQTTVEEIRQQQLKERARETQARERGRQQFRGRRQGETQGATAPPARQNAVETREGDAGFLFHRDPTLVQQGRRQFEQTWGNRPLVDDWRRGEAIQGQSAPATAEEGEGTQETGPSAAPTSSEGIVDVSDVPRDSASQADMESQRATARYELANALFRAAGRPDSSETWFLLVLGENKEHPVARKALYGLAQVHQAQGDTTAAHQAYRHLIREHPGTPYARRARQQLGLKQAEATSGGEKSRADSAYALAYQTWQGGDPEAAFDEFLRVARAHPKSSTAPRALLAAGAVYHRSARQDPGSRLQAQLKQYVDSLKHWGTRLPSDSTARPDPDTTASRETGASASPSPELATRLRRPRRVTDTTARRQGARVRADTGRVDSANAEGSDPSPQADVEMSSQTAPREADSAVMQGGARPSRRPDSTADGRPASFPDTTGRTGMESGPNRTALAPDSGRADTSDGAPSPLEELLSYLTEQYSDTPAAARAQKLLSYLERQRMAPDSTATDSLGATNPPSTRASPKSTAPSAQDSVRTAGAASADSLNGSQDSRLEVPSADSSLRDTSDQASASMPEAEATRATQRDSAAMEGRWAIVVASKTTRSEAQEIASTYETQFDAVEVLTASVDGTSRYRVAVGRYGSLAGAKKALDEDSSELPSSAWVIEFPQNEAGSP